MYSLKSYVIQFQLLTSFGIVVFTGLVLSSRNVADEQHHPFVCPCGECTIDSYFAKGCPKMPKRISTNEDILFPYLDTSSLTEEEKQDLEDSLLEDMKKIDFKYGHLVTSVRKSLQKQGVTPGDLATSLVSLELFKSHENQQSGFSIVGMKLTNASSIQDIFQELSCFWSFFNYELLEYIIQIYGTPADEANLQMYLDDLKTFCRRKIFEVPPHAYGNESNKENCTKWRVKLDDEIKDLLQLRKVKRKIAKLLGLELSTLILCDITKGCVEVVFLIPQLVAQKVFPLSDAQRSALSANHVKYSSNLVHSQHYSEASNLKENPATSQPIRQPTKMAVEEALSSRESLEQVPVLPLPRSPGK